MTTMTNYRDLSTTPTDMRAGFQFEFYCEVTGDAWRSPFRPYRRGQLTGILSRATMFFYQLHSVSRASGYAADAGARKAKAEALLEAQEMAAQRFLQCGRCQKWVCHDAWDRGHDCCIRCAESLKAGTAAGSWAGAPSQESSSAAAAVLCPNCQAPSQGGRFCHECGFDMASAFKSCPACGITLPRQARFCTDCGHGF